MAQLEFYFNDVERFELVEFILSKNTEIIIDKLYPSREFETIKNLDDLKKNLEENRVRYFLINNNYKLEELDFLEIDFDNEKKYKISQRVGGPYIDLVFYLGYSKDSTIKYKSSSIDYYAKFIHYRSYEEYKVPENLKIYYKELITFIKSKCINIKKNNKSYWISKKILKENNI